jgi:hypothetical protein
MTANLYLIYNLIMFSSMTSFFIIVYFIK